MSVEYFVGCKQHKVACWITDNKGNHVPARNAWMQFLREHIYEGCGKDGGIILLAEYEVDDGWTDLWNESTRGGDE